MKKLQLIEILNKIEGNPEIKFWNGMVGDWMDISPAVVQSDLVKMNLQYWLESCRLQDCNELKNWDYQLPAEEVADLTKRHKTGKVNNWEINPHVTVEDIKNKKYSKKTVYILNAKTKGERYFDRLGDINY
jgi:hypothetical protein